MLGHQVNVNVNVLLGMLAHHVNVNVLLGMLGHMSCECAARNAGSSRECECECVARNAASHVM